MEQQQSLSYQDLIGRRIVDVEYSGVEFGLLLEGNIVVLATPRGINLSVNEDPEEAPQPDDAFEDDLAAALASIRQVVLEEFNKPSESSDSLVPDGEE